MAVPHLGIDEFFIRLTSLFNSRRNSTHGSIFLTQKRCATPCPYPPAPSPLFRSFLLYTSSDRTATKVTPQTPSSSSPTPTSHEVPFADLSPSSPLPVLIRASNGKSKDRRKDKVKLSTIVQPDELEGFFTKYAEIMKAGTTGLKKRDRSGRKKAKAKKKGKGAGTAELEKK